MKNIFRKNQVIITALAIMIVVAGYINFSLDKGNTSNVGLDDYVATNQTDVDTNSLTSSADIATGDDTLVTDNDEFVNENDTKDADDTKNKDTKKEDSSKSNSDKKDKTTSQDVKDSETADISDEDIAAADDEGIPVSDTGELANQTESEDTTGEAVLVNTTINNSFFSSAKLKREQTRAKNRESLMALIDDKNVTDEQKQDAIDNVIDMTAISEKENLTETSLEAKGFSSVVTIIDGSVEVVVNANNLTEQDIAVIENTVKNKTGITVDKITITPVKTK